MTDQTEMFFGLSNTAWTAISSLSTFLAVLVALYFPISEKLGRRKKIYRTIENEIRKNFCVLEKAKTNHLAALVGPNVPKYVMIAFSMGQINIDYWEVNRQFVSEASRKRYDEYSEVNNDLKDLKLFAQELLVDSEDTKHFDKLMVAFDMTYAKMKTKKKYW